MRLADVSASGLVYPFGPFAARQAFLKSQPDLVSRFMKAYVEGIYRFKTDKALALAPLRNTRRKKPPQALNGSKVYATKYFKRAPKRRRPESKPSSKRFPPPVPCHPVLRPSACGVALHSWI